MKVCKICKSVDDGTIPFVKGEHKCISCRNKIRKDRYHSDTTYRTKVLESQKITRSKYDYRSKYTEYHKEYALGNWDAIKVHKRKYRVNNPHKVNSLTAKRRCNKLKRTPIWLTTGDCVKINMYYLLAQRLTKCLQSSFQVDHIIPLQGRLVSGLHVPSNLQVISSKLNSTKNNTFTI